LIITPINGGVLILLWNGNLLVLRWHRRIKYHSILDKLSLWFRLRFLEFESLDPKDFSELFNNPVR
jgi:hypothetical protein